MAMNKLHDLFLHELGDILDAEKQITKALPMIIETTTDPMIKRRVEQHLRETEQQIQNLEACFKSLGEKAKAEKCPGMAGLLTEHQTLMKEKPSTEVTQVANLAGSAKVEHYEIVAYTSLVGLAKMMAHTEAEELLRQNLMQEQDMARFLEQNMPTVLDKIGTQTNEKGMGMKQMAGTR
jgi:ferritin-like metal-binding protein YciE